MVRSSPAFRCFVTWGLAILLQGIMCNDCPPLPFGSLSNGKILRSGRTKLRFQCHDGYFLSGASETYCYKGKWTTKKAPTCYKSGACEHAPEVPNAVLHGTSENNVGSVVQYVCNPGYIMLGRGMRTCLESGYWSGITPACMSESEPLQDVADRLGREFITKMASHTSNSRVPQARYLDKASLKKGLDLVFLVDRSSSIDPYDLNIGKKFMKFLCEEFNVKNGINPNGSRIAVIAFGTNVDVLINFNESRIDSPETAASAIDELLLPNGGGTAMVPAMTTIFLEVLPFIREEAKLALFLISDGEPNVGSTEITPEEMGRHLKEFPGFEIFAVGIGPDVNRQLLASVASEPVLNHVFLLKKYSDLNQMMTIIENKPTEVPPVRPEKCGHVESGDEEKMWPWIAAVYTSQEIENITSLNICGGVLICSQWVLTAASCFFQTQRRDDNPSLKEVFVVLGEDDLTKVDANQANFYALDVKIHPDFNPMNDLINNVAVIKLNEPAPIAAYRPVCLPPTDGAVPLHLNVAINATIAGWGACPDSNDGFTIPTTIPRHNLAVKQVIVAENQECFPINIKKVDEISMICIAASYADSCVGNIGSPLLAQDPRTGIFHVIGIQSRKDIFSTGYAQHVELRKYIPWINDMTDKCPLFHWN